MDRHDAHNAMFGGALNKPASLAVNFAALLQVFAKLVRIHRVGLFVNVDEYNLRPNLRNCFGRGNERMRNGDNDVVGSHTGSHEREAQRIRSTVYANTIFRGTEFGEFTLKIFDHRSADKSRVA